MIVKKKVLTTALAVNFAFLGIISPANIRNNEAYASQVNKNSGFYRSTKTRSAYLELTDSQRVELDGMNTNNNSLLTLKELRATGRYSLPIVKGRDWLYPFMLDKNKDGQVGENQVLSDTNTAVAQTSEVDVDVAVAVDNSLLALANPNPDEKSDDEASDDQFDHKLEGEDKQKEREESKQGLKTAIKNAKYQMDAATYLIEYTPSTVASVRDKLVKIIEETQEYIKEAEELLAAMEN